MLDHLRGALDSGSVRAWFQPVVLLSSGAVTGYEALARWVRDDGTTAESASFVPAAAGTDVVLALDLSVLDDALALAARIGGRRTVAVNVSSRTLVNPATADLVLARLKESGVAAERLCLEARASDLQSAAGAPALAQLAAAGVRWYVDGCGADVAPDDLEGLPVAGVKLDRSVTGATAEGSRAGRAARRLAEAAADHRWDTVASGVETRGQHTALASAGWVHGQGWLFGRPMPPDLLR